MDLNGNDQEIKEELEIESEIGDNSYSEFEALFTAEQESRNRSLNSNRPSSSSNVPEEIDNGPFVQFESSVGIHNDDLAEKLLNDAFDPPITILIGEENIQILKHGIILEQSPFFRHAFKNNRIPVNLTEFDRSAVESLIRYLYTGKLNISKSNVQKLLVTADKFELIDVKEKCIHVMQDSLDNINSFTSRNFAKSHGIPSLLNAANAFIANDLPRLVSSQLFLDLGSDDILELMNSSPRGYIPSATIFSAILAWVQHDEPNRESHLPQLMKNLSLDDLFESAPELLEVPFGKDGILARNIECLFNYAEALKRWASKSNTSPRKRRRIQSTDSETDQEGETSDSSPTKKKNSEDKDSQNTEDVHEDTSNLSDSASVILIASPRPGGHEQLPRKSTRRYTEFDFCNTSDTSSASSSDSTSTDDSSDPWGCRRRTKCTARKATTKRSLPSCAIPAIQSGVSPKPRGRGRPIKRVARQSTRHGQPSTPSVVSTVSASFVRSPGGRRRRSGRLKLLGSRKDYTDMFLISKPRE